VVERDDRGWPAEKEVGAGGERTGERFGREDTKEIHCWQLAVAFFLLSSLSAVRISRTPSISGVRSGRYFPGIDYEP